MPVFVSASFGQNGQTVNGVPWAYCPYASALPSVRVGASVAGPIMLPDSAQGYYTESFLRDSRASASIQSVFSLPVEAQHHAWPSVLIGVRRSDGVVLYAGYHAEVAPVEVQRPEQAQHVAHVSDMYLGLRSRICKFGRPRSVKAKEHRDMALIGYIQTVASMETWNTHNPHTGQALVHEIIPLAWNIELIQKLVDMGMKLDLPTRAPDRFVNSTLLHGVAGGLARKIRLYEDEGSVAGSQPQLDMVKYRNCLVWLCKKCPATLQMQAQDTNKDFLDYRSPLDLLRSAARKEVLTMLRDDKH